jgi:hypothetical protein
MDADTGKYVVCEGWSEYIDVSSDQSLAVVLTHEMPLVKGDLVVVLGIRFYQAVNGDMCVLEASRYHAMVVIEAVADIQNSGFKIQNQCRADAGSLDSQTGPGEGRSGARTLARGGVKRMYSRMGYLAPRAVVMPAGSRTLCRGEPKDFSK